MQSDHPCFPMNIGEFFGFGGYSRTPEGYFSPEHLGFVSGLVTIMILCAIGLSRKYKHSSLQKKNRCLIISAILIDGLELGKILIMCLRSKNPMAWTTELPLFLCSIQLITIPLAAFSKGRIREGALDFVTIFGLPGAVLGTYFAGQNYNAYPVLSMDNVVSGLTHCISGFCSLYILLSGMVGMKKKSIPITLSILGGFCLCAYVANQILDYNYMFLRRGDGTPYDILYNLVKGNPVLYPLGVVALFILCIWAYYSIYYKLSKKTIKA